jgi:hypothetical protein
MNKSLIFSICVIIFAGCTKDDILIPMQEQIKPELAIQNSVGIKLETPFVSKEVSMNVKLEKEGTVVIKITDISNRVVSKEQVSVKAGDNLLKVYTSALPSSSYRIGIYDSNNNLLGITDFNKIN